MATWNVADFSQSPSLSLFLHPRLSLGLTPGPQGPSVAWSFRSMFTALFKPEVFFPVAEFKP